MRRADFSIAASLSGSYDAHGEFREAVWQRWLDNDPLSHRAAKSRAFSAGSRFYS